MRFIKIYLKTLGIIVLGSSVVILIIKGFVLLMDYIQTTFELTNLDMTYFLGVVMLLLITLGITKAIDDDN